MIEELLKILYPAHYGFATDNVHVDYSLKSGFVELYDAKACDYCNDEKATGDVYHKSPCDVCNFLRVAEAYEVVVFDSHYVGYLCY